MEGTRSSGDARTLRHRVVFTLACVLALAVADQGALSAVAGTIQSSFGISPAQFGALGSASTGVSALATLGYGSYVDRASRTRLLAWSVLGWAAAMVLGALASSYTFLLCSRVLLGMVVAAAYPAVASLIGDWFHPAERGHVYGLVIAGEFVGTGAGIVVASIAASAADSWRAALVVLAVPALAVCWLLFRLPEPARGGASRLPLGRAEPDQGDGRSLVRQVVEEHAVRPREALVLHHDPVHMGLPMAIRYTLRIPTNVIVIVASALGYFFFSGLRFFVVQWIEQHFAVSRTEAAGLVVVAGVAAIAGVLTGGKVVDHLLDRGRITARVVVPAITFVAAAVLLAPGIAAGSLGVSLALLLPGGFLFASSNPPLDAARLDVMPARLWGRAESVRALFRGLFEAAAPVTFGLVATDVFSGPGRLTDTFLMMLAPLLISGAILLVARRTYAADVATAEATERALSSQQPRANT